MYSWNDSILKCSKNLIVSGDLCNSRIYTVQEDSYNSTDDCANYPSHSEIRPWMEGDTALIKEFN